MDTTTILCLIAMIGGIGLIIFAVWKKAAVKKALGIGMFGAVVAGLVLAGVGYYFGGGAYIDDLITPPAQYTPYTPTVPTTTGGSVTFTITPTAQGNSGFTLNSDKTRFSLPIFAWTSTHVIKESDNTTWVDADMKFVIQPVAWTGATANDLATIYFEFNNPELSFTVGTTTYYAITKTSNRRNIEWNVMPSGTYDHQYSTGSHSMVLTDVATVYCNTTASNDLSYIENLFDPLSTSVTFYNADRTWTKTYGLDIFLSDVDATV